MRSNGQDLPQEDNNLRFIKLFEVLKQSLQSIKSIDLSLPAFEFDGRPAIALGYPANLKNFVLSSNRLTLSKFTSSVEYLEAAALKKHVSLLEGSKKGTNLEIKEIGLKGPQDLANFLENFLSKKVLKGKIYTKVTEISEFDLLKAIQNFLRNYKGKSDLTLVLRVSALTESEVNALRGLLDSERRALRMEIEVDNLKKICYSPVRGPRVHSLVREAEGEEVEDSSFSWSDYEERYDEA